MTVRRMRHEDPDAQVVSDGVSEQSDGNSGKNNVFVVQNGGNHRHERRRVDECNGGGKGHVAINFEKAGKQNL